MGQDSGPVAHSARQPTLRDNGFVYLPKGIAQPSELVAAVARIEPMLGPDVVRLRYDIGTNWSGEPALFLRVVLTDQASRRDRLHKVTSRIRALIEEQIDPLNSWGLFAYVNFRSRSEQEMLKEPAWE